MCDISLDNLLKTKCALNILTLYLLPISRIRVIIPYHIVDYYIINIGDMQNEIDFYGYCSEFEHIHDFVKVL